MLERVDDCVQLMPARCVFLFRVCSGFERLGADVFLGSWVGGRPAYLFILSEKLIATPELAQTGLVAKCPEKVSLCVFGRAYRQVCVCVLFLYACDLVTLVGEPQGHELKWGP